jgi:hypothetical protein
MESGAEQQQQQLEGFALKSRKRKEVFMGGKTEKREYRVRTDSNLTLKL